MIQRVEFEEKKFQVEVDLGLGFEKLRKWEVNHGKKLTMRLDLGKLRRGEKQEKLFVGEEIEPYIEVLGFRAIYMLILRKQNS